MSNHTLRALRPRLRSHAPSVTSGKKPNTKSWVLKSMSATSASDRGGAGLGFERSALDDGRFVAPDGELRGTRHRRERRHLLENARYARLGDVNEVVVLGLVAFDLRRIEAAGEVDAVL